MKRTLFFLIFCAGLVYGLQGMERGGRFHDINRKFLSWLTANTDGATASPSITILRIEKDDDIFDWPPTAIDFATMFNQLNLFTPKAIAVEPVLFWQDPHPQRFSSLVRKSEVLSPLLLGVEFEVNSAAVEAIEENLLKEFEPITNITGDKSKLPRFTDVQSIPDESLRKHHQLAHTYIDLGGGDLSDQDVLKVPLLARHRDHVFASFVLKAVLLHEQIPVDEIEVRLGESIKAGDSLNIPIDSSGHFAVSPDWDRRIPSISANVLMVGPNPDPSELGPNEKLEDIKSLHNNLILIGRTGDGVREFDRPGGGTITRSEILASAIGAIQSGRYQIRLSNKIQYVTWGVIILIGLLAYLAIKKRATAVVFGAFGLLTIVIVGLLTFQSTSHWCPPTIPAAIIVLSAVLSFFSASKRVPETSTDNG